MATKKKLKVQAGPPAPQNRDECAAAIADFGRMQRNRDRLMAEMNDKIAAITSDYQPQIDQHDASLELRLKSIQTYCEANRDALTEGGKVKFANLVTGTVEWRKATDSVKVTGVDAVIQLLEERQLVRFIRTKKEINKEAILLDRDAAKAVPGIQILIGKEAFYCKPFEVEA
jgi:phage host-nuclease inhibitor protein Gam